MSIRLADLLAPREADRPLYLSLDHISLLVQAEIVVASILEDGSEITVFGSYRKSRLLLGEAIERTHTLVIEVPQQEYKDLVRVVEAIKGKDEFLHLANSSHS